MQSLLSKNATVAPSHSSLVDELIRTLMELYAPVARFMYYRINNCPLEESNNKRENGTFYQFVLYRAAPRTVEDQHRVVLQSRSVATPDAAIAGALSVAKTALTRMRQTTGGLGPKPATAVALQGIVMLFQLSKSDSTGKLEMNTGVPPATLGVELLQIFDDILEATHILTSVPQNEIILTLAMVRNEPRLNLCGSRYRLWVGRKRLDFLPPLHNDSKEIQNREFGSCFSPIETITFGPAMSTYVGAVTEVLMLLMRVLVSKHRLQVLKKEIA